MKLSEAGLCVDMNALLIAFQFFDRENNPTVGGTKSLFSTVILFLSEDKIVLQPANPLLF